ncbi:hypothetical protein [Arthrobacter sp. UYCo732]|uniref:RDD family protein n=1 Tax=Arthrobacter sp. UYCo732 TaxID=3156336 RepID=UPI0033982628
MTTSPEEVTEDPAEVTDESGGPIWEVVPLGDGRTVAPARYREVAFAWAVDAGIVFAATFGVYIALAAAFPDPFSFARELNALAAWPAVAFLYGLTASYRRSLGQRIAGTRTLRIDNGAVPGFWRSGWMMVLRVLLLPVVFVYHMCGGSTFGITDRHISVDALATGY